MDVLISMLLYRNNADKRRKAHYALGPGLTLRFSFLRAFRMRSASALTAFRASSSNRRHSSSMISASCLFKDSASLCDACSSARRVAIRIHIISSVLCSEARVLVRSGLCSDPSLSQSGVAEATGPGHGTPHIASVAHLSHTGRTARRNKP